MKLNFEDNDEISDERGVFYAFVAVRRKTQRPRGLNGAG